MTEKIGKRSAKKGKATYFYSIIGVALVLFFLGFLGMIIINADQLSKKLRERLEIQVMMRDGVDPNQAMKVANTIKQNPKVMDVVFVNKDEAAKDLQESIGDNFVDVLGYNPLNNALNVKVKSQYVQVDSLSAIAKTIEQMPEVESINFDKASVSNISSWIRKISIALGIFSVLLVFSVIILIDNTVRLAMFSSRFLIKTMQMVGATQGFIAKPFNQVGIRNGLISGALAILGILGLRKLLLVQYPEFAQLQNDMVLIILMICILVLGILITYISTHRSVTKYLKTSLDDLY